MHLQLTQQESKFHVNQKSTHFCLFYFLFAFATKQPNQPTSKKVITEILNRKIMKLLHQANYFYRS